jgi:hypothetical protein
MSAANHLTREQEVLEQTLDLFRPRAASNPKPKPEQLPDPIEDEDETECLLIDGTVREMTWLELFKAYKNLVKADQRQLFMAIQKKLEAETSTGRENP